MMKRIFALILCFIMMVNLIPMSTFAVSDNDISEEAAEETEKETEKTPCLTCGQYDCTSDHTNWCYVCKKDDCGTTHVWCETCQKNDCGVVSHGKELPRITEESVSPAAYVSEEVTTEFQIKDLVKFNRETVYVWSDPSNYITQTPVTASGFPAEMRIVEKYAFSTTLTLYKLEAADGSEWPADFLEYVWAEGKYLTKVEEISCDCGCENCIGEEGCVCRCGKCDFCEKEPENTCECCENCTGAEGCECFCGECDFCEKTEEPSAPSVSATVNGQTITASGNLGVNAELVVSSGSIEKAEQFSASMFDFEEIKAIDQYSYDISLNDSFEGAIELSLSGFFVDSCSEVYVIHFLDSPEAIQKAMEAGTIREFTAENLYLVYPEETAASGENDTIYYEELPAQYIENNIVFSTTSFSEFVVYIVSFEYKGISLSIPGGSGILLSELFRELQLDYSIDEVDTVKFSNSELVSVEQEGSDWRIISLQPFRTEEKMTITFKDTSEIIITVIDDQNASDKGGYWLLFLDEVAYDTTATISDVIGTMKSWWYLYDGDNGNVELSYSAITDLGHRVAGPGVQFGIESGSWWYTASCDRSINYQDASGSDDKLDTLKFGAIIGGPTVKFYRYSNLIYTKSNAYTVRQKSKVTMVGDVETRNVEIYENGTYITTVTKTFPKRDNDTSKVTADVYAEGLKAPFYTYETTIVNGNYRINLKSHYAVNASVNGTQATASPTTQTIDHGKNATITFTASEGYLIDYLMDGSTKIDVDKNSYTHTISNVTSVHSIVAYTKPITYSVNFNANGGANTVTGSMPTLNMTYDVETTLPRCKYVNSGDGMVFLGWATSPTGEVVYKDGAKIKNLTTTNGVTVTLYAKWKDGLDSIIYIGINNTYHNPNGIYKAGGVTINSYHTYPNEPAQMIGDFDRVTDDNGSWRYDSASAVPLKNKAKDYINGNIFNSPDYEMTYVSGENTLGIADPTGSAVRSMLKFTEADYNAMITVWLEGMRTTLVGYGDTTFDWQNAKAEDFVMVPYVIKFQDYDSWYIDMVVVPKALYTLAYDGNIENGYTASFSGVAFPPSSQYTDGSMVNVVNTPIGYQGNNMKVTKVVDGHTYEAIFQYWYDAEGNIYGGATEKNTIKLEKNTILYAKWEYPDAKYGNLEITKTVVDKDSYTDPTQNQEFSFTFKTSASGSYNYAIYDHSANVKARGTIANNGTFKIQDGWRIRIIDIPKDENYSITETAISYYTNVSGPVSGTINAGATTYATVTNEYQKYADYTVKHFLQNADKNGYTEQADSAKKLHGIIGTDTKATASTYSGYTPKTVTQKKIQADGKTVIEIYYDLIAEATIKWNAGDGKFADGTKEKQTVHKHGTIPTPPGPPSKESTAEFTYTFDKWTPNIVEVTGDTTYTATYSETRNKYKVTGTIDNNGTVSNSPQEVEYGNVNNTMVFTPALGYEISGVKVNGKACATFNSNSYSFSQKITELTIVEVTTSCVAYTISYELNGGELAAGVTNPGTYTIETETFTLNNPTRAGYKFKGWATSQDAATGMETVTVEKGTTGNKTYYAVWEKSSVDLTITAVTADTEQSFIFTVSGTRSDGVAFESIDVVLCSENRFQVTIKDLPVGEYTVTEKDDWSWRESTVISQTADLRTESKTLSFDFGDVDDLHWLSGYSYKRKKGDR